MLVRKVHISSWHKLTIMSPNSHSGGLCEWIKQDCSSEVTLPTLLVDVDTR